MSCNDLGDTNVMNVSCTFYIYNNKTATKIESLEKSLSTGEQNYFTYF